jgi:hypothetical protein
MVQNNKTSGTTIASQYRGSPFNYDYFNTGVRNGYSHYNQTMRAYLDVVIDDIEYNLGTDIFTDGSLKALDIGCATGLHVNALNARGLDTDGIDISSYAIGVAQTDYPTYTFINEDIMDNTIADDTYDILIGIGLFACMPDKTIAGNLWSEISRITKTDWRGYFTLNVSSPRYLNFSSGEVSAISIPGHTVTIMNLLDSGISDPDELYARTTVGPYGWKVVIT